MIWSLLWRLLFHLENILMAGETGDVKQLFSNSAKSCCFGCFFWTLIANGTVIYLVHFTPTFYHMQLKEANRYFNILLEISLAGSTSSFGIFSIFPQSMVAVLLFFPSLDNIDCHLLHTFLTVFLIAFPVSTCCPGPELMPHVLYFDTTPPVGVHFYVLFSICCVTDYTKLSSLKQ